MPAERANLNNKNMSEGEPKIEEQEPEKPERTSGIMRVAGVSAEEERIILERTKKEYFDKQTPVEGEREKSPEESEIINDILAKLPEFIKEYGGTPLQLKPEHIHVVNPEKLSYMQRRSYKKSGARGGYTPEKQTVEILAVTQSKLIFGICVAHELIHFNSFQSAQYSPEGDRITERVFGVSEVSKDEEHIYFDDFNETITEELAARFEREHFKSIPLLHKALKRKEEMAVGVKWPEEVSSVEDIMDIIVKKGWFRTQYGVARRGFLEESAKLWEMIKEIQQKNSEKFKTDEDVFRFFTKAYFTGKRLGMARLIENTFGKGSFRELGKGIISNY